MAESHFHPSYQNERYYYTESATLILDAQKTYDKPMTGGEFTFTLKGGIAFDNYYDVVKPGSVEITGTKAYKNARTGIDKPMEPRMFTFRLTGHGQDLTAVNEADGSFSFNIFYTKADIGREYIYTVSEAKGDKNYITYDADTFQVKVRVEDDGQGGLKITKTLDADAVQNTVSVAFENTYNIIHGGQVAINGTKTYTDERTQQAKEIPADLFSFRITGTDG